MATKIRNYGPPPSGDQQQGGQIHEMGKKGIRNYRPAPLIYGSTQDDKPGSYKQEDNMKLKTPKLSGGYD